MNMKQEFETVGYVHRHNILNAATIARLRNQMLTIMRPYCAAGPDNEAPEAAIDRCFSEISAQGQDIKSNIYKMFGRLSELPMLLADKAIKADVSEMGFSAFTIQAYSVFCLEPGNTHHYFLPHQDLRNRTSLKSLIIWAPLSAGPELGGMACWPGSHLSGPMRHGLSERGQLMLPTESYANFERTALTNYEIGDVIFMNPYLIHESVVNTGEAIRWTAVVKIDDIESNDHLADNLHPFSIDEYIDSRTNEQRLFDG